MVFAYGTLGIISVAVLVLGIIVCLLPRDTWGKL